MTERRPFKDRLVSNVNKINAHLAQTYCNEQCILHPEDVDPKDFVAWIGLKPTPTALRNAKSALKKLERR